MKKEKYIHVPSKNQIVSIPHEYTQQTTEYLTSQNQITRPHSSWRI